MDHWMWSAALVPLGLWALTRSVDWLVHKARQLPEGPLRRALLFGDDGRCRGYRKQASDASALDRAQRILRLPGPKP